MSECLQVYITICNYHYYLQLGWYIRETSVRVYELHTYERGQGRISQGHVVVALANFCTYQASRQF